MSNAITSKGLRWELLHSLFIVWVFVPLLYWVPFVWIGLTARKWQWLLAAILYAAPVIAGFILAPKAPNGLAHILIVWSIVLAWGLAIIHAFMARTVYLTRLEQANRPSK